MPMVDHFNVYIEMGKIDDAGPALAHTLERVAHRVRLGHFRPNVPQVILDARGKPVGNFVWFVRRKDQPDDCDRYEIAAERAQRIRDAAEAFEE